MAQIYVLMGKSATGKDTIYKKLLEYVTEEQITTPRREGEAGG